jgi:GTP-binding protein
MKNLVDMVRILFTAGNGGDGWVSFRREKYVPKGGPDGGDGGNGGSIILRTKKYSTLANLSGIKKIAAQKGQTGMKKQQHGRDGEDTIVEVPLGTVVWQVGYRHLEQRRNKKYYLEKETERIPAHPDLQDPIEIPPGLDRHTFSKKAPAPDKVLLARLIEEGQEYVLCKGGRGGSGNVAYKSARNTTPLEAEYGQLGQERLVVLELELLADVGLVGLPNAGKSTFISRVTKARPKVANYPFTTLTPNLGIWQYAADKSVVVADIPGLIEGASAGKGLGHDFLRHIKACQVLFFFVYLTEVEAFDETMSDQEKAELVWKQYSLLSTELKEYSEELPQKPRAVVLNKIDIYSDELQAAIKKKFVQELEKDVSFLKLSAATSEGVEPLADHLKKVI